MVDGGVRAGADVVKALAPGAQAALVGRAARYGVCAAGEAGALRGLEILHDELCGVRTVSEIGPDLLAR